MTSHNGTEATSELPEDTMLQFELTDEALDELISFEGLPVVGVAIWESSLADELEEEPPGDEARMAVDVDLYLEDGVLLEIYAGMVYPSEDEDALMGMAVLERAFTRLVEEGAILDEVAESEDGGLALVFTVAEEVVLMVAAGAWAVDEWEELPVE